MNPSLLYDLCKERQNEVKKQILYCRIDRDKNYVYNNIIRSFTVKFFRCIRKFTFRNVSMN